MTENTENTQAQMPPEAEAEIAAACDQLVAIFIGKRLDVVLMALTAATISLAGDREATPSERKVRAAFILQRAMQAADAAEMTSEELIQSIATTIDIGTAAEGIPDDVAAGAAALLAATAGETPQ